MSSLSSPKGDFIMKTSSTVAIDFELEGFDAVESVDVVSEIVVYAISQMNKRYVNESYTIKKISIETQGETFEAN